MTAASTSGSRSEKPRRCECTPATFDDPACMCTYCEQRFEEGDAFEKLRRVRDALERPDEGWCLNTLLQSVRNANAILRG